MKISSVINSLHFSDDNRSLQDNCRNSDAIVCRSIDVAMGWPGKAHDARVLSNFRLFFLAETNQLFPEVNHFLISVLPY